MRPAFDDVRGNLEVFVRPCSSRFCHVIKQRFVMQMLNTIFSRHGRYSSNAAQRGSSMSTSRSPALVPVQRIMQSILVLRHQRVILDSDLAAIYGVSTGRLNEAVKRNFKRFPCDFMFRLSAAEHATLISQIATSKLGRGGRRKLPWAFTEYGAIQAANVLNSPRAVAMGVYVVRAFVKLRELLVSKREFARRLDELEAHIEKNIQKKIVTHDEAIAAILFAIRQLMGTSRPKRRPIGFTADLEGKA